MKLGLEVALDLRPLRLSQRDCMITMAEATTAAAFLYAEDIIDEEEVLSVVQSETERTTPLFPYLTYKRFTLNDVTDDESLAEFRFYKGDITRLVKAFHLPPKFICNNGTTASAEEGLCMLLRRLAYPCRYSDIIPRFGRSKPELCMIVNTVLKFIYTRFEHLLSSFQQGWLHPDNLTEYAMAVYSKCQALDNCWGFVDGTVRPICRPGENQRVVYNGHKRVHALKYQSVVAANGMIANLYGPVEGRSHDAGILRRSELLHKLEQYCNKADGSPLCIFGDPAYPVRPHIQAPYKNNNLSDAEKDFNKAMSSVRVSVEWVFGEITEYFAFVDFKKTQKIALSEVGTMYKMCALLRNARTCLYGSSTSTFFGIDPPTLEEYFSV